MCAWSLHCVADRTVVYAVAARGQRDRNLLAVLRSKNSRPS